jgi:hypothetical protein
MALGSSVRRGTAFVLASVAAFALVSLFGTGTAVAQRVVFAENFTNTG